MKKVFFLIDGLADSFKNSPLKLAKKDFIDSKLKDSFLGYIIPTPKKYWKSKSNEASISGIATLSLLGYEKFDDFKRGPYEAIGNDIFYKNGWLAIRIDFATVDKNLKVLDRRAGRSNYGLKELVKAINRIKFDLPFKLYHTTGHRGVLIFKKKLSEKISDSDPYENNKKVKKIKALKKDRLSIYTAEILQKFLDETHKILDNHKINLEREKRNIPKANYLLTRQAGNKILKFKNFFKKNKIKNGVLISEKGVVYGVCKTVGFKLDYLNEAKDIKEELRFAKDKIFKNYKKFELVLIHLKKGDEAGHDKDFNKKKKFFEEFDKFLKDVYKYIKDSKIIITGDHITDVRVGKHMYGPVPILIINSKLKNNPKEFSEEESLKYKRIKNIWEFLND
jgi:2,3-bisphosphoglycerate-independent phosphoglycerate mutase